MRTQPPATLAPGLQATSTDDLIALGHEAARELGTYRARLVKQERVDGKLLPPQTMDLTVHAWPRAVRFEVVAGPKTGRRVLWREGHRPSEMLVREGGILGMISVWVDVDGKLARRDTNHRVTELGFGPLLDLFENDFRSGRAQGGHARRDFGFGSRGDYCIEYTAPRGAHGLYAQRALICIDPSLGLPAHIEVFDGQGLLERLDYSNVQPNQKPAPELFEDV